MTKRRDQIMRHDRRITAQVETLAHLFDVSPATIRRVIQRGNLKSSDALGPVVYRVDDVENLLFPKSPGDNAESLSAVEDDADPSVRAVHAAAQNKKGRHVSPP